MVMLLKEKLAEIFKAHRIATLCFGTYVLMWVALYLYIITDYLFFDTAHADRINYLLLLAFLLTLPFVILLMIIAVLSDQNRKFYLRLSLILIAPLVLSILLGVFNDSQSPN
ncbi:hypothetical protein MUY27_14195 [Mucilaginibacter sp. RS28]|uniref:Uncharacterized protein n=1 Tax=Mucilaginibacter straminoryzae TaxID=2932774 RepID=A0A9X1X672_9SPHI|nr:hypothetical protein [Mucilaginibacter straminoryzae]MCJ8210865.1 hypothetical protein [Mucilaginibacter straminoryzae]